MEERPRRKVCILSIDGGGMRGIIPARVLEYMEESLQEKTGDGGARAADFFDLVAGTSVGGVIATMLVAADDGDDDDDDDGGGDRRPMYSSSEVCKAVVGKGKEIFHLPPLQRPMAWLKGVLRPRYSSKSMEGVLKEYLKDRTLKNTVKPLLVPCYDLGNARPFVFSNSAALKSESLDFSLVGICRATSAVPGLFKPSILSSIDGRTRVLAIDGGLVMNNPAAAAITHVLHNPAEFPWVSSMADILLLSLGTGLFHRPYPLHSSRHVLRWGALQWAKPVARIVLDGLSDMVDHFLSIAFHGQHRSNYLRIQVSGIPSRCLTEMDDPSDANVQRLMKIADDMLNQPHVEYIPLSGRRQHQMTNKDCLDQFVDRLIAEHRARQTEPYLHH